MNFSSEQIRRREKVLIFIVVETPSVGGVIPLAGHWHSILCKSGENQLSTM